jgi:hypothetical protein
MDFDKTPEMLYRLLHEEPLPGSNVYEPTMDDIVQFCRESWATNQYTIEELAALISRISF